MWCWDKKGWVWNISLSSFYSLVPWWKKRILRVRLTTPLFVVKIGNFWGTLPNIHKIFKVSFILDEKTNSSASDVTTCGLEPDFGFRPVTSLCWHRWPHDLGRIRICPDLETWKMWREGERKKGVREGQKKRGEKRDRKKTGIRGYFGIECDITLKFCTIREKRDRGWMNRLEGAWI